jgi:hypothetical protein
MKTVGAAGHLPIQVDREGQRLGYLYRRELGSLRAIYGVIEARLCP